jgi:hypothetical protein
MKQRRLLVLVLVCVALAVLAIAVSMNPGPDDERTPPPYRTTKPATEGRKKALPAEPEWKREIDAKLEEAVSFDFGKDTPLADVVAYFRRLKKLNVVLGPEAAARGERGVALCRPTDRKLRAALAHVCGRLDLAYAVADGALFIGTRERIAALDRPGRVFSDVESWERYQATMESPISLDFAAAPLEDVAAYLRLQKGVNIVLDDVAVSGGATRDVTLRLDDVEFAHALTWVCRLVDLDYRVRDDAVFISTKERLAALDDGEPATRHARRSTNLRARLKEPLSFDFVATPLEDVVAFLRNLKNVNIVVNGRAITGRDLRVTLRLDHVEFETALRWVCVHLGLDYAILNDVIYISTPEDLVALREARERLAAVRKANATEPGTLRPPGGGKLDEPVSFDVIATPLPDVVAFLRALMRVNIVIDKQILVDHRDLDVTLRLKDVTFGNALAIVCQHVGLTYIIQENVIYVSTMKGCVALMKRIRRQTALEGANPAAWKPFRVAMKAPVSIDLIATPLGDVLDFFRNLIELGIAIDKDVAKDLGEMEVTLRLEKVKFRTALTLITQPAGLAYTVRGGAIYISTPARIFGRPNR